MNTLTENTIILGDCLKVLPQIPSNSVNLIAGQEKSGTWIFQGAGASLLTTAT